MKKVMKKNEKTKGIKQGISGIFQTVVVGVDFSAYSKLVVKQAEKLARQFHAHLVLVYAVIEPWQLSNPEVYSVVTVPPVEIELSDIDKEVKKFYHPPSSATISVLEGPPYKVLAKAAKTTSNPLIVIGSCGRGTFSRFMLGSNAEQIALTSTVPVWVHRGKKLVSFDRVLVPMDLSESAQKVGDLFRKWSRQMKFSLSYIFIRPEVPSNLDRPDFRKAFENIYRAVLKSLKQFKRHHAEVPLITAAGDPAEKIFHFSRRFDVIAMSPHNRTGLFKVFGKVTTKVIRLSHIPVLVLKPDGV